MDYLLSFSSYYLAIQAIGAVALVFVFLSWNAKTRDSVFLLQSINLVLFTAHYLLLAALPGALMCAVVLARNAVFSQKGRRPWAGSRWWLYGFIALAVAVLGLSWQGWPSVLPVAGVVAGMWGMWQDTPVHMRRYMLLSCLLWMPYTVIVQSWPGFISQLVGIGGILLGMYRLDRQR